MTNQYRTSVSRRRVLHGIGTAGMASVAGCNALRTGDNREETNTDDQTADPSRPYAITKREHQAFWFGRYNMNAMLLMTGLGERLDPPQEAKQNLASIARFDLDDMPANPYLLKAVYAAGDPHFQQEADFSDLSTLYWDRDAMETALTPDAQAFTIQKIVSNGLRTEYHRGGKDRFIALVQLREALALGQTLRERLTTPAGLVATRTPDGDLTDPNPEQQAAALGAYSSLALALTDPDLPLYREFPESSQHGDRVRRWADDLFAASQEMQPETVREIALTLGASGWYGAATNDAEQRRTALARLRELGNALYERREADEHSLTDLAWAVYGLAEASQVTESTHFADAARQLFFDRMEDRWQSSTGVYADETGDESHVYTPAKTAAVFAAVNAIRFVATPGAGSIGSPAQADRRYARLVQTVLIDSGMQQAHAIPLAVNPTYLDEEPREHFTADSMPLSADGHGEFGLCPVYAAEVVYENDDWTVADRTFQTADAMHLALFSPSLHREAPAGFVPIYRLIASDSQ